MTEQDSRKSKMSKQDFHKALLNLPNKDQELLDLWGISRPTLKAWQNGIHAPHRNLRAAYITKATEEDPHK